MAKKSTTQASKVPTKPFIDSTVVKTPKGPIVLPPGAIPVKTVVNSSGNQVIVLQQPISQTAKNTGMDSKSSKKYKSASPFSTANAEQLRIIGDAVKNVSQANKSKSPGHTVVHGKNPTHTLPQKAQPVVRYEWEAPINEYNAAQTLERTLAVTESLRMVMVSLKEDMKKANHMPITQCLEKKRLVGSKLKRAMGAFKKQIQDIELFCRSTYKNVKSSSLMDSRQVSGKKSQPYNISIMSSRMTSLSNSNSKDKKDVEVIELSSSDDEEPPVKTKTSNSQNTKQKTTDKGTVLAFKCIVI